MGLGVAPRGLGDTEEYWERKDTLQRLLMPERARPGFTVSRGGGGRGGLWGSSWDRTGSPVPSSPFVLSPLQGLMPGELILWAWEAVGVHPREGAV